MIFKIMLIFLALVVIGGSWITVSVLLPDHWALALVDVIGYALFFVILYFMMKEAGYAQSKRPRRR